MHFASSLGDEEIVKVLLEIAQRSGKVHEYIAIRNMLNRTALDMAKLSNINQAVIALLESYEVDQRS